MLKKKETKPKVNRFCPEIEDLSWNPYSPPRRFDPPSPVLQKEHCIESFSDRSTIFDLREMLERGATHCRVEVYDCGDYSEVSVRLVQYEEVPNPHYEKMVKEDKKTEQLCREWDRNNAIYKKYLKRKKEEEELKTLEKLKKKYEK